MLQRVWEHRKRGIVVAIFANSLPQSGARLQRVANKVNSLEFILRATGSYQRLVFVCFVFSY